MFWRNKSIPFTPATDIPSLQGKVIFVTGGNNGLGKQSILEFARHDPAEIWLAARSFNKARKAADDIKDIIPTANIHLLELDLASFDSVKDATNQFLSSSKRLDILMLNAGIMAAPADLTKDGYELQFGTNHMGHALLTRLLLPVLTSTSKLSGADVRVVSLASHGHVYLPQGGFRFDLLKTTAEEMGAYSRYFQSKLSTVLWVRQISKLHPGLTITAIDPGTVQTGLLDGATGSSRLITSLFKASSLMFSSVEKGACNQLWAAVGKNVKTGVYYEPVGIAGKASSDGVDDELAQRLWDWTENELATYLA
ncbi:hypothetical protein BX600DRAFT_434825 [Xylariales sp. PMI_506]|nr:hypothetical protein BX600DRAFT_434825 [Xylariales sp. PMI_506]